MSLYDANSPNYDRLISRQAIDRLTGLSTGGTTPAAGSYAGFQIRPAPKGGFIVSLYGDVLFAAPLDDCLAFIRAELDPAPAPACVTCGKAT